MGKIILCFISVIILISPCRVEAIDIDFLTLNPNIETVKQFSDLVQVHKFKYYEFSYITQTYMPVFHCTHNVDNFYSFMAATSKQFRYRGSCYTSTTQAQKAGIVPQVQKYKSKKIAEFTKREKSIMIEKELKEKERIDDMISELENLGYNVTK